MGIFICSYDDLTNSGTLRRYLVHGGINSILPGWKKVRLVGAECPTDDLTQPMNL